MANVNSEFLTMLDVMTQGKERVASNIVDLTRQMNPIVEDAPAIACNKGKYHETTIKTGLPTVTWAKIYKGVPTSKARYQSITHTTGEVESAVEVDRRVIDDVANYTEFAAMSGGKKKSAVGARKVQVFENEQISHAEAMTQEVARALFYENQTTNPERITGLSAFFNDPASGAEGASQILTPEGNPGMGMQHTSMWYCTWHPQTGHLIYPSGESSKGGFSSGKVEKEFSFDEDGHKYRVYRRDMRWKTGLVIRDFRYFGRIANINVQTLDKGKAINTALTGADLDDLMTEMHYRTFGRRMAKGKSCIYCNTTILMFLDYQVRNSPKNLWLRMNETAQNGKEVLTHRMKPIKETDQLLNTEAPIS